MDVLLSTGNVITEAVWKCQSWLESVTDVSAAASHAAAASDAVAPLPWDAALETADPKVRKALRESVLALSQNKDVFLRETPASLEVVLTPQLHASAGAVLQEDAALQELRFRLVPRRVSEEQFWQRYFAAAAELRRKALGSGGRYGEYGSGSHHSGGGGGGGSSACGGGRAMSEHSTSTAAGMSVIAGSSGSPGQHVRWSTAADVRAATASRLGKTLSQVSSLAAEMMLSPRALHADNTTAAAATTAADAAAATAGPQTAAAAAPQHRQQPPGSRDAEAGAAPEPAAAQQFGSTNAPPFLAHRQAAASAPAAAQPRRDDGGATEALAAAAATAAAAYSAAAVAVQRQPPDGRAGAAECASDDGDWSHCSDSFMDLGADIVSHDADWMVL